MELYAQAVSVYCDSRIKTSSAMHSLENVLSILFTKVAIERFTLQRQGSKPRGENKRPWNRKTSIRACGKDPQDDNERSLMKIAGQA